MSEPASVVVSKSSYWMRVSISLQVCVKKALLDTLHDPNIGGLPRDAQQQLYQKIQQFKQNSKKNQQNTFIDTFQWEMMCHTCTANCPNPCPRREKTNSEDLDIPCIVILITKLTKLSQRTGQAYRIRKTAVHDARKLRNDIHHCALKAISTKQKFDDYWDRIQDILTKLRYTGMAIFRELKTVSLDTKTKEQIAALKDQVNTLRADMESQQQQTDEKINQLHNITDDLKQQINGLVNDKNLTESEKVQLQQLLKSFHSLQKRLEILESKVEDNAQEIGRQDVRIKKLESGCSDGKTSEMLSKQLKQNTKDEFKNIFTSADEMDHKVPETKERGDVVVGLSFIEKPENVFFQVTDWEKEETRSKKLEVGIYRGSSSIVRQKRTELETVSSQEANYDEIMTTPNDYVIISGPPGCGKSTLCETLAYNWACNEHWTNAPNFDYVFVLRFRDLNDFKEDKKVTAEEILRTSYREYFKEDSMVSNLNSLLILDGFDEFSNKYELLQERDKRSNFTRAVFDLLNPNNKKLFSARLVTSRPSSCSVLFKLFKEQRFTPFRTFEITGFSIENINEYVEHFWKRKSSKNVISETEKEKLKSFLTRIKETPTLRSMMTIPFYCSEVCRLMFDGKIGIDSIPITYTGLFCNLLTLFLRDHGLKRQVMSLKDMLKNKQFKPIILMLSKFAFIMETEAKITFTESDFRRFKDGDFLTSEEKRNDFKELLIQSGLVIKFGKEESYQFFHYSFHEFLVALYIFRTGPVEGLVHNAKQNSYVRVPVKDYVYNNFELCSYIMAMVCGLAGGSVTDSKSDFFVKEYARIFQSDDSPSCLQDILSPGINIRSFGMFVFEYQNIVHLTKSIIIEFDGLLIEQHHFQYLQESGTLNNTELLVLRVDETRRRVDDTDVKYWRDLPMKFDRVIWESLRLNSSSVGVFGALLSKCREKFEMLILELQYLSMLLDRYEYNEQRLFTNLSIIFHVGGTDFSSLSPDFLKWCQMFKAVTIAFTTQLKYSITSHAGPTAFFLPPDLIKWLPYKIKSKKGEISQELKEKVKEFANKYHSGNLNFAASNAKKMIIPDVIPILPDDNGETPDTEVP